MIYELWSLRETDPRMMRERLAGTYDSREQAEAEIERRAEKYPGRAGAYAIREVEGSQ